jgi:hypothetical protein
MELRNAIDKANQILDEERLHPTVGYKANGHEVSHPFVRALGPLSLQQVRSQRPRPVQENPREWVFESTNYTLLCALMAQVAEDSSSAIFSTALLRLVSAPGSAKSTQASQTGAPSWMGLVSELPLVAEFCVRNGFSKDFFRALGEANPLPGHAVLLRHLEDMIALNFTVFTDAEYEQLEFCINAYSVSAERGYGEHRRRPARQQTWLGIQIDLGSFIREIDSASGGIREECRKARYFYLKGALLEGLNLEINQDKDVVQSYLRTLGFSEPLSRSFDEAHRLYDEGNTAFVLKAAMGHLRSFLENLHAEAMPAVLERFGGTPPSGWGPGLVCLRKNGVLSEAEEKFAAGLFGLISDEGVHPLFAEREYARLARNVVIEYALLFLKKLEKLGLKRSR